jgi:hypothetical protein
VACQIDELDCLGPNLHFSFRIGQGERRIMTWLGKDSADQLGAIRVIYFVQRRVRWERAMQGRKERSRNPGNLKELDEWAVWITGT